MSFTSQRANLFIKFKLHFVILSVFWGFPWAEILAHGKDSSVPPSDYRAVVDPEIQRMRVSCGPNSLYMLLQSHGVSKQYNEVCGQITMQEEGCTILSLRNAAQKLGLNARIIKCSASELSGLRLPAILHFSNDVFFGGNTKHFVLLTGVSADGIEYLDGTSGRHENITMKKFTAVSDGYALEPIDTFRFRWLFLMIPIAILVGGITILRGVRSLSSQATKAVCVFCLLSVCGRTLAAPAPGAATLSGPNQSVQEPWRTPKQDAVNVLDLYFKTIGQEHEREIIASSLPKNEAVSLVSVSQAATSLGVPLKQVRPTVSDLANFDSPIIVHLFDDQERNGGYFLLLKLNGDRVAVVNAAVATIEFYHIDEFRRRWSGYALVPEVRHTLLGSASITLICLSVYAFIRPRGGEKTTSSAIDLSMEPANPGISS